MSITHHLVIKTLHTMFSFAHTSHINSQSIPLQHTDSQISTLSSLGELWALRPVSASVCDMKTRPCVPNENTSSVLWTVKRFDGKESSCKGVSGFCNLCVWCENMAVCNQMKTRVPFCEQLRYLMAKSHLAKGCQGLANCVWCLEICVCSFEKAVLFWKLCVSNGKKL